MKLEGRAAIVTGSTHGVGRAIALELARHGARVVVNGRGMGPDGPGTVTDEADAVVEEIRRAGGEAIACVGAVNDLEFAERLVETCRERFGRVDILVNNAGTNVRKQPQEYTVAEWRELIDTNLTSAFVCSNAAYPHMKRAGGGKIINIGSMMSIFGASFSGPYAATKGGIVQMARAMACAWAKDNIQVNSVLPGWIDTELTQGARRDVEGLQERVVARTPAGRWGLPTDFAGIAVFLASPASDFVTGTAIPVDGGYSIQA
jgi:2-deoxy-D-gluconate 3-dehydrogenase